jgi:hypothetical protein
MQIEFKHVDLKLQVGIAFTFHCKGERDPDIQKGKKERKYKCCKGAP